MNVISLTCRIFYVQFRACEYKKMRNLSSYLLNCLGFFCRKKIFAQINLFFFCKPFTEIVEMNKYSYVLK